jgi:hypothetical protein
VCQFFKTRNENGEKEEEDERYAKDLKFVIKIELWINLVLYIL